MSRFYLIRHGANDYLGRALAGHLPVRLNAEGIEQVRRLAAVLQPHGITRIYSSPIQRSLETAEPLANLLGIEIQRTPEFQEIDFGQWTDQSMGDLEQLEHWKRFNSYRSGTRVPGGEWMLEAQARFVGKLEALRHEFPGDTIAITSHADPIKAALAYYLGSPLDLFHRIEIDPASYSIIDLHDHGPVIRGINLRA